MACPCHQRGEPAGPWPTAPCTLCCAAPRCAGQPHLHLGRDGHQRGGDPRRAARREAGPADGGAAAVDEQAAAGEPGAAQGGAGRGGGPGLVRLSAWPCGSLVWGSAAGGPEGHAARCAVCRSAGEHWRSLLAAAWLLWGLQRQPCWTVLTCGPAAAHPPAGAECGVHAAERQPHAHGGQQVGAWALGGPCWSGTRGCGWAGQAAKPCEAPVRGLLRSFSSLGALVPARSNPLLPTRARAPTAPRPSLHRARHRICNQDIIGRVKQVICFAFHDSSLLLETCSLAREQSKIVTLFYLD